MADYQIRRSPNATLGFIDGKTKFTYNHTMEWLEGMESSLQKKRIDFAVNQGAKLREKASRMARILQNTIAARRERMSKDRHEKIKKGNVEKK